MKKLVAILLITVFVSSSFVKLYKDFTNGYNSSFALYDVEDDSEEKDNDLKKDKVTADFFIPSLFGLSQNQKFYIAHLFFLPNPYFVETIIPPNTIA